MNEDEAFLTEQYTAAVHLHPDYKGVSASEALLDYRHRIATYMTYFEPIDFGPTRAVETHWSYFKCDHTRNHFVVHNVTGNLPLKVVHFIMNLRTTTHPFYLSRHGQSEYNAVGRIGGDSSLSQHGLEYAKKLAEFVDEEMVKDEHGSDVPCRLWTSTLRRTKETAQFI